METHKTTDDCAAIRAIVTKINLAWRNGRFQELGEYFHPRMTIAIPWSGVRCQGHERCTQSYAEFMGVASIDHYSESEATVDVFGDTAIAVFEWSGAWTVRSSPQSEAGYDVWVFAREAGEWRAVWRTQVSRPSATQGTER